jgi:hypothetical protein
VLWLWEGHSLPVAWWYRELNCEVVGMCVEAGPVMGAESVDFLFN